MVTKSEKLHSLLPAALNTKQDPGWSALLGAIGEEDERLAKLIESVRNQFFVKTASRPYLDRLAANSNISRPRFVGVEDSEFRQYIPIIAYQPKQVRHIIDQLLDLFFYKEATTAFLASGTAEPFSLKDGWELILNVDNEHTEYIKFLSTDFSDIQAATADELVAAYNRQAKYSFATTFFDSVTKKNHIRIFTATIGHQGSLQVEGGLANISLHLNGFLEDVGLGSNTQWSITKTGDVVTVTHTGGTAPGISKLQVGDLFLCDLPGNKGTFVITEINPWANKFTFKNLFATAGSFTQSSTSDTKFLRPGKYTAYKNARRALVWETQVGRVTVEMPATSSIVKRGLRGGFHVNGSVSIVDNIDDANSLTLENATNFPESGKFIIEPVDSVIAKLASDGGEEVVETISNGRVISNFIRYSYTGKSGNTLTGVTPNLVSNFTLNEVTLTGLSKSEEIVTCTASGHNFNVGDIVCIKNSSGIPILTTTGTAVADTRIISVASTTGVSPGMLVRGANIVDGSIVQRVIGNTVLISNNTTDTVNGSITFSENTNGSFEILTITPSSFTYRQLGVDGSAATAGTALVEQLKLAKNGSLAILTTALPAETTGIVGPYVWDDSAEFTLSSNTAVSVNEINAGKTVKLLNVADNTIPDEEGYVVFDYGLNSQEGPVKYLYRPTENILVLDPSYVFKKNHEAGCSVVALSHRGPHKLSGTGKEYPPYLTNPAAARKILQELVEQVSSAGTYIDFLVRYPEQLYGTISVYD